MQKFVKNLWKTCQKCKNLSKPAKSCIMHCYVRPENLLCGNTRCVMCEESRCAMCEESKGVMCEESRYVICEKSRYVICEEPLPPFIKPPSGFFLSFTELISQSAPSCLPACPTKRAGGRAPACPTRRRRRRRQFISAREELWEPFRRRKLI